MITRADRFGRVGSSSERSRSRLRRMALMGIVAATVTGPQAFAQIQMTELRAGDGTTYQVIRAQNLGGGAEQLQITTVAGAIAGTGSCSATGNMSGDPTSAIGGVLPPQMTLHPYDNIVRTFILTPNDNSMLNFDPSFGGRVTLGSGGSALNVCKDNFDCQGQVNVQTLVALSSNAGGVPTACIATMLNAGCDGQNNRNTFGFGLPNDGMDPPVCTSSPTINSVVCAAKPTDGFPLNEGQAIVFIYNHSLASSSFAVATGAFGITTNADVTLGCNADTIVSAAGANDSQPAPAAPTSTPTNTPTNTATSTATATNTPTATNTATATFTASNTPTATATRTNTPTATFTAPPTPTRPPIPVVPSPTSPAGIVMIIGLAGGLLWALRRLARVP